MKSKTKGLRVKSILIAIGEGILGAIPASLFMLSPLLTEQSYGIRA